MGLGPCNQKTHITLGETVGLLRTKTSNLGLGWSCPCNLETGESSFSGPSVLETSNHNCFSIPSSGRSELIATKNLESSMVLPTTTVQLAVSPKGTLATISPLVVTEVVGEGDWPSLNQLAQPPFVPTGPAMVAQASDK